MDYDELMLFTLLRLDGRLFPTPAATPPHYFDRTGTWTLTFPGTGYKRVNWVTVDDACYLVRKLG